MGSFDRFYDQLEEQISFKPDTVGPTEGIVRFPAAYPVATTSGYGGVIDLVNQAAEAVRSIENQASEAEKTSYQKLELARKRIEELESELRSAQRYISEARVRLKAADDSARADRSRVEAAEKKMCDLEMRARTAEAQAKENATALARIEEAIRTQLLAKRLPPNNMMLSA